MTHALVIPIRRLPNKIKGLDYLISVEQKSLIRVGQLVKIPLRGKDEFGIVYSLSDNSDIKDNKLKPISEIVLAEPLITENLLNFYSELSDFYRASLGFILKCALLPMQKRKLKTLTETLLAVETREGKPQKPKLWLYNNLDEKKKYLSELAKADGQVLILTPDVNDPEKIQELLPADISNEIIILKGDDGDKQYSDNWIRVRNSKNIIVIGTRKALFLPWHNLTRIIMDDEGSPDYKSWDMAPRYHTRDAALALTKHTSAELFLVASAPSVESYYFAEHKIYDLIGELTKITKPSPIFVNALAEKRGGGAGILAEEIIKAIEANKGQTFIHLNRRGTSGGMVCADCGNIFRCDKCHRPLTYYERGIELKCLYCKTSVRFADNCPKCGGANYRLMGLGIEGVATALKNKFPSAKIITIDKETANLPESFPSDEKIIFVGTDFAYSRLDWKKIDIFVMADPDTALAAAEYRALEFLWLKLRRAQLALAPDAKLFIQTQHPEHRVYQGVYDPKSFYESEIAERKIFGYPPHNYLARIIVAGATANKASENAEQLFRALNSLTTHKKDVMIYSHIPANPPRMRNLYHEVILLKFNYANYKKSLKELAAIVPDDCKVDPNPNHILSIS
ncbi:MAG: primosomal protein N' [Patescibacteria group bacterium]